MYPTSEAFGRYIRQSGQRKTVVDVYYDGQFIMADLPVSGGSIRVDLDGDVRRSGSLTIADRNLVRNINNDIFTPLGTEIRIRQGIVYPDGTEELVPLGMFRLETANWSDAEGSVPSAQLYDRSKHYQVPLPENVSRAGLSACDVIIEFLNYFLPSLNASRVGLLGEGITDYIIPGGSILEGGTYWAAMQTLAANMGGRLYFDAEGTPVIREFVDLNSSPSPPIVWELNVGPGGVLINATHSRTREGVYNCVTVTGAATENAPAPTFTIKNTNPTSPSRWDGPYGRVPLPITDSTLTTVSQCETRAKMEISKYLGAAASLDFTAVPNPALDVEDVIRGTYLDGTEELHLIASLNIPLGSGTFTGTSKGTVVIG